MDATTNPRESPVIATPNRGRRRARASWPTRFGTVFLLAIVLACMLSLPWTMARENAGSAMGSPRYNAGETRNNRVPPWWAPVDRETRGRLDLLVSEEQRRAIAESLGLNWDAPGIADDPRLRDSLREHWPNREHRTFFLLGSDEFGRSLFCRVLAGGGISLAIGLMAALVSVVLGTLYGALAAYAGGWVDGLMMRVVDILYGLPYVLLVVLLAIASEALVDEYVSRTRARHTWSEQVVASAVDRDGALAQNESALALVREQARAEALGRFPQRQLSEGSRLVLDLTTLVLAIGGVSWLTMARVVRGQVLSIKARPFMEAARALGVPAHRQFLRHLLPNLVGPIVVYATLTVPQAILQESFLSFLGIGVKPPLPSWGNLAAAGLPEINPFRSHWWLLAFPCALLALTLVSLNVVGEALRERWDPRASRAAVDRDAGKGIGT